MKRYLVLAAVVVLAVIVVAGWRERAWQRQSAEAEGRYRAEQAARLEKERAIEAKDAALQQRDRELVERLVQLQAREKALTAQLAEARRGVVVAKDRAEALKTAPLADVLRAGEALGIRARVR